MTFVLGLNDPHLMQPDQLMELWGTALKLPNGRAAALSAAVTLLSSSSSPVAPPVKGVTPERILYLRRLTAPEKSICVGVIGTRACIRC